MREYNEPDLPEFIDKIEITNIPQFDIADYNLTDDKEVFKYLTTVERVCRNSRCYKKLIDFLRNYVDMNKCSFYKNINNIDTSSIKIHIHHSPFTLFDIANIIYMKRMAMGESLSVPMVAKEVMYCHYNMWVGLIPLSETVHEMVHNGYLFIPTDAVYGKYKEFVEQYKDYLGPIENTLERLEEATKAYDYNKETKILTMNAIYIDPTGAYELPDMNTIVELLKEKVDG